MGLGLPRVAEVLRRAQITTLGGLHGADPESLVGLHGLGPLGVRELTDAVDGLLALPAKELRELSPADDSDEWSAPSLPASMLSRLVQAKTLDEELAAILEGQGDRNTQLLRDLWSHRRGWQPTLEEVGRIHGITRERTRQVARRHEEVLAGSRLRLRIANLVVGVLDEAGGALPTGKWVDECVRRHLVSDPASLSYMPTFARLGLCRQVKWNYPLGLWLTSSGAQRYEASLSDEAEAQLRAARQSLRTVGAIREDLLASICPFDDAHALRMVWPKHSGAVRVGGHVVLLPTRGCAATRVVRKLLCVSSPMTLRDVYGGLERWRAGANSLPPLEVVERVLDEDREFKVDGATVSLRRRHRPDAVLSRAEAAAVHLLENEGPLLLWAELVDGLKAMGFSEAMAAVLMHGPLFVRPCTGVFGLRGRPFDSAALRRKRRERRDARAEGVIKSRWVSPDCLVVDYRVTRFSLQGLLGVPSALHVTRELWLGRLPDGTTMSVKVRKGFVQGLREWFSDVHAVEGDLVVATFYIGEGRIDFEHVPHGVDD